MDQSNLSVKRVKFLSYITPPMGRTDMRNGFWEQLYHTPKPFARPSIFPKSSPLILMNPHPLSALISYSNNNCVRVAA